MTEDRAISLNAVLEAIDIWDSYAKTIERIKQLPSVEPQDGDLISRQAVKNIMCDFYKKYYDDGTRRGWDRYGCISIAKLEQLPSVSHKG